MDAVNERVREIDDRRHLLEIERQLEAYLASKRMATRGGNVIGDVGKRIGKLIAMRKQIQKRRKKRVWWGQPFRGQFSKFPPKVQ